MLFVGAQKTRVVRFEFQPFALGRASFDMAKTLSRRLSLPPVGVEFRRRRRSQRLKRSHWVVSLCVVLTQAALFIANVERKQEKPEQTDRQVERQKGVYFHFNGFKLKCATWQLQTDTISLKLATLLSLSLLELFLH